MDWRSAAIIFGLLATFWTGVRLFREGNNRPLGILLGSAATTIACIFAITGSWAPILYLLAAASLVAALEIDRSGHRVRRVLGLLGITVWFVALVIAGLYT